MEFAREVSEKHLGERRAERNVPAVKKLTSWPSMDEIVSAAKMELGEIRGHDPISGEIGSC
ncbi:MAG: hypothetical protein Q7I93_03040, partial [Syntrophales bacterium]|nr:hypothetical protein [Syntrophales bacterium]